MTKQDIENIYSEFHVPAHILNHMKVVACICKTLGKTLKNKGINFDMELTANAALLHDVLRVCDMKDFKPSEFPDPCKIEDIKFWKELRKKYGEMGHEQAMSKVLRERGEKKLGQLIEKHAFMEIDNLQTWEEKILYYADKRVDRDKVVSLKTRFEEGSKRNRRIGDDHKKITQCENKVYLLEEELREILGEAIDHL